MSFKVVGIDLGKNSFQVCVLNSSDSILSNRKVNRGPLLDTVRELPEKTTIAMEWCATSHHWGRIFRGMRFNIAPYPRTTC